MSLLSKCVSVGCLLMLGCDRNTAGDPGGPLAAPSLMFSTPPRSLAPPSPLALQSPASASAPVIKTPAPQTIEEALGGPDSLFPTGFEDLSLDWNPKALIDHRPWVGNEGRLAPRLSYIYREAAFDVGSGHGDNQWLIDNKIFGGVEYHFQHNDQGEPIGALHKVVFLFDVSLPKEAADQIRAAGDLKWGPHKTEPDEFGLEYDRWSTPTAVVYFYYSRNSVPESLEVLSKTTPATLVEQP